MLPQRLALVRHGESEGNVMIDRMRSGDNSGLTPAFMERSSHTWRLTPRGHEQAQSAGEWLKKQHLTFDLLYASQHVRALQTAIELNIPNASWRIDMQLRERDWGIMDFLKPEERTKDGPFGAYWTWMDRSPFYHGPANGESIAKLTERLRSGIIDSLHRQNPEQSAIIVTHGEVMWAFRFIFERLLVHEFEAEHRSDHPHDEIYNCQIIEYRRTNPNNPSETLPYYGWVRSICPWDEKLSTNTWRVIERRTFSNEDLQRLIETLQPTNGLQ
jgi:broad specificity phosphatase PhoE